MFIRNPNPPCISTSAAGADVSSWLASRASRINMHGAQAQTELYSWASSSVAIARTGPWDLPGGMGRARCSRDGQDALAPDCRHYPRDKLLGLG